MFASLQLLFFALGGKRREFLFAALRFGAAFLQLPLKLRELLLCQIRLPGGSGDFLTEIGRGLLGRRQLRRELRALGLQLRETLFAGCEVRVDGG